jgi:hypothetical protein
VHDLGHEATADDPDADALTHWSALRPSQRLPTGLNSARPGLTLRPEVASTEQYCRPEAECKRFHDIDYHPVEQLAFGTVAEGRGCDRGCPVGRGSRHHQSEEARMIGAWIRGDGQPAVVARATSDANPSINRV